ncbi:hypothetical protein BC829DRAFT_395953 [Chytridium lagenaria]|nr:hypothetical protein BC829DRAFT_395953 [Chytridium lagenaria]
MQDIKDNNEFGRPGLGALSSYAEGYSESGTYTSAVGLRHLQKLGWKQGDGLGKQRGIFLVLKLSKGC